MQRHDGGLFQPADQRRRRHRYSRRRAAWLYNHSRSRDVPERAARPEKGSPARLRQSRAHKKVAGVWCCERIPMSNVGMSNERCQIQLSNDPMTTFDIAEPASETLISLCIG